MSAADFLPARRTLTAMRAAVQGCRGCDLYANATQAVFGDGPARAEIVMVGEQPGDREDLEGRPFVGPAGRVLSEALDDAGIDRRSVLHPSSILRAPDEETRRSEYARFVDDLRVLSRGVRERREAS